MGRSSNGSGLELMAGSLSTADKEDITNYNT